MRRLTDARHRAELSTAVDEGLSPEDLRVEEEASTEGSDGNPSEDNYTPEEMASKDRARERRAELKRRREKKERERALKARQRAKNAKKPVELVMFGAIRAMKATRILGNVTGI